jgi:hypothetical protein
MQRSDDDSWLAPRDRPYWQFEGLHLAQTLACMPCFLDRNDIVPALT